MAGSGRRQSNGHGGRPIGSWWMMSAIAVTLPAGCQRPQSAQWLLNGFLDPTQVGQFNQPKRNEIRSALSILEEPVGIQGTEEPTAEDLLPDFADVHLGPGDVVNVSVYELLNPGETTGQQVRIGPSGFETLPVLGRVKFGGLTPRELELELKAKLREMQILEDAEVQVVLVESRGAQYSVLGSVARPGTYNLPSPDYRLLNALAESGGVPPQLDKVYVFRRGAGMALPSTSMPAEPAATSEPMAYTMSETSSSPATTTSARTTSAASSLPAAPRESPGKMPGLAMPEVDELKILEGAPEGETGAIQWDPVRQEWVVGEQSSQPRERRPGTTGVGSAPSEPGAAPAEEAELTSSVRIIEVPLKELLEGDPRYNVVIRSFDLINVPPGNVGEYFMMGNVTRTGAYDLTGRRLTVKEAIAAAGGFGPLAWPSRADLVRRISRDEEQIIQLDLDAIFAGTAPDFYLKPNDIINVGSAPQAVFMAVIRNAFRFSYGFGFVYDRNFADEDTFDAQLALRNQRNSVRQAQGLPPR